jgi:hypothetical protein
VAFVVDKVALGQVFSEYLPFFITEASLSPVYFPALAVAF